MVDHEDNFDPRKKDYLDDFENLVNINDKPLTRRSNLRIKAEATELLTLVRKIATKFYDPCIPVI